MSTHRLMAHIDGRWHLAATLIEFEVGEMSAMFWHSDKRMDTFKSADAAFALYGKPNASLFRWESA